MNTNLCFPDAWTWIGRNEPGETNLVVSGLPKNMGFFRLGPPNAIRPGFDQMYLTRNDDESSDLVSIGFPINFFGTIRSNLYANNNGNVSFDTNLWEYVPTPILLEAIKYNTDIIAPFWADVDTRTDLPMPVSYGTNTINGHLAFGVDWLNVGYYNIYAWHEFDKTNSFQLVIIDRSDRASGDYDIEFNYAQVQWETGDVSGGYDGLGGSPVRIGYAKLNNASNQTFELYGSGVSLYFLDANPTSGTPNPTGLIYTHFNSTVPGRYAFQFHNGTPMALPPGTTNQLSAQVRMLAYPAKPQNQ
jgi:hypothetical protein